MLKLQICESDNMQKSKKSLLIVIIVIIIVALGAGGYYFFVIKKAVEPIIWDGSYKMTGTLACKGDIPGLDTMPMDTTVIVSSNKIVEQIQQTVKNFDIDKHGKATEIAQQTGNGVTTDIKADYQFYQESGAYRFDATGTAGISVTKDGKTYSSTCSGAAKGVRQ